MIQDGLVLALDAGDKNSYPGSGTTWFDVSGNNNGTLTNGPTFNSSNGGSIVFDGVDDFIQMSQTTTLSGEFTLNLFILPTSTNTVVLLGNAGTDYLQINNPTTLGLFSATTSTNLNNYVWDTTPTS